MVLYFSLFFIIVYEARIETKGVYHCAKPLFALLLILKILNMPFPQLMQFGAILELPGMRVTFFFIRSVLYE